jgi:hypothetical protein
LLFQLVELGVLPRERLPPRGELSKCFCGGQCALAARCNRSYDARDTGTGLACDCRTHSRVRQITKRAEVARSQFIAEHVPTGLFR